MTFVHLHGLAIRGEPLDDSTIVPATVPVFVEYDPHRQIGTAVVQRDEQGIWAEVTAEDGPWRDTCRYFGTSFRCGHLADVPGPGLGELIAVSVVAETAPWSGLPPFEAA